MMYFVSDDGRGGVSGDPRGDEDLVSTRVKVRGLMFVFLLIE